MNSQTDMRNENNQASQILPPLKVGFTMRETVNAQTTFADLKKARGSIDARGSDSKASVSFFDTVA